MPYPSSHEWDYTHDKVETHAYQYADPNTTPPKHILEIQAKILEKFGYFDGAMCELIEMYGYDAN